MIRKSRCVIAASLLFGSSCSGSAGSENQASEPRDPVVSSVESPVQAGPDDHTEENSLEQCDLARLVAYDALVWARPAERQSDKFETDFTKSFDLEIVEVVEQSADVQLRESAIVHVSTYSMNAGTYEGTGIDEMWPKGKRDPYLVALYPDSYGNSNWYPRGFGSTDDGVTVYPNECDDTQHLNELASRIDVKPSFAVLDMFRSEFLAANECIRSGEDPCPYV